ncbi:hypothetical protein [Herpetosiphon gulosus]|uniref:DUF4340 domain-containing protein n=1 Tax=Herpetosiphon gulosus TaxID=1973496 RepID=A0ABP9WW06_9CHLR
MNRTRFAIIGLVVLLLAALGASGWLWFERGTIISRDATTQAEFGKLKDQITAADEVQDKNRQLQDQVNDLQERLNNPPTSIAEPTSPALEPTPEVGPTPTVDPAAPTPTGPGGVEPPAQIVEVMKQIEQEVIALRGLPEERPVTRRMLTREELRNYIVKEMETENTPADFRHETSQLWMLGLAEKDIDLQQLYIDLQTEQIGGFYDPETDTFYIIAENNEFPPADQITYAHEFNHNLQDQLINLQDGLKVGEFDADRSLAFRSLVEGDATKLMSDWLQTDLVPRMSPAELQELLRTLQEQQDSSTILDQVPGVLRDGLVFPYEDGLAFAEAVYAEGGWEAVTKALQDPPTSTEQILHPEKYLSATRDNPTLPDQFDLLPVLGADWTTAITNTVGEFDLKSLLEYTATAGDLEAAAAGIGGGRVTLYEHNSDFTPVLQWTLRWDTAADGDEFLGLFYGTLNPNGDLLIRAGDPNRSDDDVHVGVKGSGQEFVIVFSPNQDLVRNALNALP